MASSVPARQQVGAGQHFAGQAGERHPGGFAQGNPAALAAGDGHRLDIVFKDGADAHVVVDLHDGVADGHAQILLRDGGIAQGGQLPQAGHHGLRGGPLLQQHLAACRRRAAAPMRTESAWADFAAQHVRPGGRFVLAAGDAVGGERAHQALRIAGQADGRAQLHERLVEIAGPPGSTSCAGQALDFAP